MSDGVRLSAKIWMPIDIKSQPVPAILEIIPYRKRDSYALRDHANHAWLAAHGYACIRPDMRGHGDSEGIMLDEYSKREQQDTIEVINWLARQPWCTGKVGMMGLSWGGIASLQAAVKQPPALKAIIPVGSSVDRYYDWLLHTSTRSGDSRERMGKNMAGASRENTLIYRKMAKSSIARRDLDRGICLRTF